MTIYYFSILIVFVLWLQYEIRKNNRLTKIKSEEFWNKEKTANLTRKVDISNLDYITIQYEALPMMDFDDLTINSYRDIILTLSDKKILNLTGFTNTELKLKYGVSNIKALSEYDNNYTILVSMLHKWGERLYQQGYLTEAIAVFEFAVHCLTDVKKTYQLLAKLYKELDASNKIDHLIKILPQTKITQKETLAEELINIKNS